ncbi:BlaI/MecI/CopY family transcriptional regulator [Dyadobacter fermentans]|uniref:Transcriptional repressor, CopY family n=1 Tax=Dyadobacter fermentans (strain ATCC 700827 / DSM 18053 / CIP 107007 / KCTC 52180 / NS114) TaxID=471854 RepID=C6VWC6_DYAFD|nr:BlaI/MecI/CopY family transcriptional regulator [Dyadobacter fermentans]ACT94957.1 transcriptional repressor, CopY family [Dyadobacter fermentans DSM 18053]
MELISHSGENIMRILWELGEGVVHDIIAKIPDPKPPYTTVSSIIRLLEKKGFVGHRAYGKTYVYFPAISRDEYARRSFAELMQHYFQGSPRNMISFILEENTFESDELDDLKGLINARYSKC